MLIYNSKKKFIGIDEHDLNALGFSDLSQLKAQADDFADLFVKTPGYIHNFKHVNWIDFIACADSAESPKVIIHANSKNFKCTLDIKVAYLTDEPSSKAYLVHINNARELTDGEHDNIADDIVNRVVAPVSVAAIQTPEVKLNEEPKQVETTETEESTTKVEETTKQA